MFRYLDDISLWTAGNVCSRWRQLLDAETTQDRWSRFIQLRWPLFNPQYRVRCWKTVYTKLLESAPCRFCLESMMLQVRRDWGAFYTRELDKIRFVNLSISLLLEAIRSYHFVLRCKANWLHESFSSDLEHASNRREFLATSTTEERVKNPQNWSSRGYTGHTIRQTVLSLASLYHWPSG